MVLATHRRQGVPIKGRLEGSKNNTCSCVTNGIAPRLGDGSDHQAAQEPDVHEKYLTEGSTDRGLCLKMGIGTAPNVFCLDLGRPPLVGWLREPKNTSHAEGPWF